jgi:hypothetical protein
MMNECLRFQEMFESYLGDALTGPERESLRSHLESCAECAALLELHEDLALVGRAIPEPTDTDLLVMRRSVMAQITRQERRKANEVPWWDPRGLFQLHPAVSVTAAAALIIAGIFVGRFSVGQPKLDDGLVMDEMYRQASTQKGLSDYWDTPLSYTNVAVRPLRGNRLDLSFDVCRHMNVVTSTDSPLAKDVLLHAILAPSTMGAKMKAMSLTSEIPDPQLQDAMIFTLHNDPTLAVRLEALAIIARYPYDNHTQDALLTTLRRDESVQMRLLALEYLVNRKVDPELLQQTIKSARLESDTAVMQRAVTLTADYQ